MAGIQWQTISRQMEDTPNPNVNNGATKDQTVCQYSLAVMDGVVLIWYLLQQRTVGI